MSSIKVQVTEDWQRDALTLVPYDHTGAGTFVAMVDQFREDDVPTFRMRHVPEEERQVTSAGINVSLEIARALYDALAQHFGVQPEPASRELVDVLKDVAGREAERVDHLIGVMTRPADPPPRRSNQSQVDALRDMRGERP